MTRFRPTVEALGDRALPSAVFADPTAGQRALFDTSASAPAHHDGTLVARPAGTEASYLRITLSDVLITSYSN